MMRVAICKSCAGGLAETNCKECGGEGFFFPPNMVRHAEPVAYQSQVFSALAEQIESLDAVDWAADARLDSWRKGIL
jgi:hypothetical protein